MRTIDAVIIGGGSAGMAAALSLKSQGVDDLLILERDQELGGILQQCIHNGFGLQVFQEELSGPAFAQKYKDQIIKQHIPFRTETTVMNISKDKVVTYVNAWEGYVQLQAKAVIFACGCYERSRGAISIPGDRGKGVYTAGCAQRYLNIENIRVGNRVFILGSGDIGLIMARRMVLEGAEVLGVAELMPYSNGLQRNMVQCLQDYHIPLYLSHTVTDIKGKDQIRQITISQVDEDKQPIKGTEKTFQVDTLLLSVGLMPEISLAQSLKLKLDSRTRSLLVDENYETSISGIYACGNALHVHDLVDFVCLEAEKTGECAARGLQNPVAPAPYVQMQAGKHIGYVIPQRFHECVQHDITFSFRVQLPCRNAVLEIVSQGKVIRRIKKRCFLPAEMEKVTLKQEELQEAKGSMEMRLCL